MSSCSEIIRIDTIYVGIVPILCMILKMIDIGTEMYDKLKLLIKMKTGFFLLSFISFIVRLHYQRIINVKCMHIFSLVNKNDLKKHINFLFIKIIAFRSE